MKTCKFYLIVSLCLMSSTVHATPLNKDQKEKLAKNGSLFFYSTLKPTPVSPYLLDTFLGEKLNSLKEKNAKAKTEAEKILNMRAMVCDGDKPKLIPTVTIKFIMPKFATAPLDQVQKFRTAVKGELNHELMQFFDQAISKREAEAKTLEKASPSEFTVFALPGKESLETRLNSMVLAPTIDIHSKQVMLGKQKRISFIRSDKSPVFYAGYFESNRYSSSSTGGSVLDGSERLVKLEGAKPDERVLLVSEEAQKFGVYGYHQVDDSKKLEQYDEQGLLLIPVRLDLPYILSNYFIPVIPIAVQKKLWAKPDVADEGNAADDTHKDIFVYGYDDENLSPTKLIKAHDRLWSDLLQKSTIVKESPNDDGKTITYQLSLDLTLACKYMRPVSDFISQ